MAYLVFDVLYAGGELLIDRPLQERARILDELLATERKVIHHRDALRLRSGQAPAQRKIGTQRKLTFGNERRNIGTQHHPRTHISSSFA